MPLPALRNIDASPVKHEGQDLVCLFDPEGFVDTQLVLSPAAFFVASCLNGNNEVRDIQVAFARQFGGTVLLSEDIQQVVDTLDVHGFLLTERFDTIRRGIETDFDKDDTRRAYGARRSYPGEPGELREFIESLFALPEGPGAAPPITEAGEPARAAIVPHIDFHRGGHCYARGYHRLAQFTKPGVVIIFGVAHASPPAPFVLTRKNFETPLGTLNTDTAIVDRLAQAATWDPYEFETVHRTEHSIEFQAVFLAYLYGTDVRIVPILCAPISDDPFMTDPDDLDHVTRFLAACRDVAADPANRVTVIAGADLAHVGKRFGDPFDIDEQIIRQVKARDHEDLEHVIAGRPQDFYKSVLRDHNQRKVCGHSCIYAALKTVEGLSSPGELVDYGYAEDPLGGIVSFAGIVLP